MTAHTQRLPYTPGNIGTVCVWAGFILLCAALFHVALRLPFYSHIDEYAHVDYCVKLGHGILPRGDQLLYGEVYQLGVQDQERSARYYLNNRNGKFPPPGNLRSSEAHQAPLFYWIGGFVVRMAIWAGLSIKTQALLLRLLCAAMACAAHCLVYLAIRRVHPAFGIAALPYLLFMMPIDLVRVSNDSLAALLGAAVFLMLVSVYDTQLSRKMVVAFSVAMIAVAATKTSAFVFLLPAVTIMVLAGTGRTRILTLCGILLPGFLLTLLLVGRNLTAAGHVTGMPELPLDLRPSGWPWIWGAFTASDIMAFYRAFLKIETLLAGKRLGGLYPLEHMLTTFLAGVVVSGAIAIAGCPERLKQALGWTAEKCHQLRRLIVHVLLMLFLASILWAVVVAFVCNLCYSSRLAYPLAFPFLFPAAAGWYYFMALPRNRYAHALIWCGLSALFFTASIPYLLA